MSLIKLRTAMRKEQKCGECGATIKIGEKYVDTNDKLNPPKPFPTVKICLTCGKKHADFNKLVK